MVVAAQYMGNLHIHVVDDDREIVGRGAIATGDDQVVELAVVDADVALDVIGEAHPALGRIAKAYRHRFVATGLQSQLSAVAVVARFLLCSHLPFAQRIEALARTVAVICVTLFEQPGDNFAVARETPGLEIRALVGVETQPGHAIQDRLHRLGRRPLEVGILDTQDELAVRLAGQQPAKKRGSRTADVEHAGRARGESGPDHRIRPVFETRGILTDYRRPQ